MRSFHCACHKSSWTNNLKVRRQAVCSGYRNLLTKMTAGEAVPSSMKIQEAGAQITRTDRTTVVHKDCCSRLKRNLKKTNISRRSSCHQFDIVDAFANNQQVIKLVSGWRGLLACPQKESWRGDECRSAARARRALRWRSAARVTAS